MNSSKKLKKIYITGIAGAGKTTFSKKLSEKLNIPFHELDEAVFKEEGCEKNDEKTRDKKNQKYTKKQKMDN